MDGPANDHSDSDSGESWTLVDNNLASEEDSFHVSQNIHKKFIDNYEKDEDTDGISIISDSEPESPSSFVVDSCHSILEAQAIKEEIPIYSPETIEFTTNINNENNNEDPINEDNITGDSIKHKIYVHRRNNRLSTVLNIMMLVSVMTAAGVAIGHMWGAKNDCPSQATPSFNKILSDLYKLQAENAHYRNKLRELSLIIEDNLQNECEKESEISNNSKLQTLKCRQQKIDEIQKYLKSSIGEGRKNKRSAISYAQNPDDNEFTKKFKGENEFRKFVNANVSKLKAVKEQNIDEKLIPKEETDKLQRDKIGDEITSPDLKEVKDLPQRKISYADSLKATTFVTENNYEKIHTYNRKKLKHAKKIKDYPIITETSNSEDDFVKDGRYSIPKPKLDIKKHDSQKSHKNKKRKNKYEDWELKGGLLKDYDDLSMKLLNGNHFVKSKINANDKKRQILNKIENYQDTFNINDSIKEAEYDTKQNWFDNRAQLRKEARKKLEQELLYMDSTSNSGEWYFKRMHKREECRTKENSTSNKVRNKKENFKTRP